MYSDQYKHLEMTRPEIVLLYHIRIVIMIRMTHDSSSWPGCVKERFVFTLYSITTFVFFTTNNFLNTQLLYHLKR